MIERYCETKNCFNISVKNRKVCNKCRSRLWRERNPVKASYCNLRSNAKRRRIEFLISFEYWISFCKEHSYIENTGNSPESYTVERIEDDKGYIEGNLTVLKRKDNVSKENRRRGARNSAIRLSEDYHSQWQPGGRYYTPLPW